MKRPAMDMTHSSSPCRPRWGRRRCGTAGCCRSCGSRSGSGGTRRRSNSGRMLPPQPQLSLPTPQYFTAQGSSLAVAPALPGHGGVAAAGQVFHPLAHFLHGAAAQIGVDVGFAAQLAAQLHKFVGAKGVVLHHAAPVGVDHALARLPWGRRRPASDIRRRSSPPGPAQAPDAIVAQRLHHVGAHARSTLGMWHPSPTYRPVRRDHRPKTLQENTPDKVRGEWFPWIAWRIRSVVPWGLPFCARPAIENQ